MSIAGIMGSNAQSMASCDPCARRPESRINAPRKGLAMLISICVPGASLPLRDSARLKMALTFVKWEPTR